MKLPDGWLNYKPIGRRIEGTRFIAFKVPLNLSPEQAKEKGVTDENLLNIQVINEHIPNLGLVIDLTNTTKYYDSKIFTDLGIEYKKIFVPGRLNPSEQIYNLFISTVADFLQRNSENDKIIGVHCTHGLNRTGLMICTYMIQQCNFEPCDAISKFELARGHQMERDNYLEALMKMKSKPLSESYTRLQDFSLEPTTSPPQDLRTFDWWTDNQDIPQLRGHAYDNTPQYIRNIRGTIYVDGRNLIPDGPGRFLLPIDLRDIRPMPNYPSYNRSAYSSNRSYNQPRASSRSGCFYQDEPRRRRS